MRSGPRLAAALLLLVLAACGDGSPAGPGDGATAGPIGALSAGVAGRWPTATPRSLGLDPAALTALESQIDAGAFGEISSLLVLRHGTLVYERYWGEWTSTDLHRVYSVTKSVTSLVMGIARAEGHLPDLSTPVLEIFPEYESVALPEGKTRITLEHVLQMRTGLEWDELSTNYTAGGNPTVALTASPDWIKFVLDLPLAQEPGSRFTYNSGVSMLMAGTLEHRLHVSAEAYAAEKLFGPLGITEWMWDQGPGSLTNSGWGLLLLPRDMAAIGQLVLDEGMWKGRSVVPAAWLDTSDDPSTHFTDGTGYGYQWWLDVPDGGRQPMAAWGWGGQFIVVIPSLDMVMITTAENFLGNEVTPYTLADFGYLAAGVAR